MSKDKQNIDKDKELSVFFIFFQKWLSGIDNEIKFWVEFFGNGTQWKEDFERRTSLCPKFKYSKAIFDSKSPKVLDVGSGPISDVGIATDNGIIELYACDPFAEIYNSILHKYSIDPYVKTEFALLERLSYFYRKETFDMVCMHNALDHAFDPVLGLHEMMKVTKKNGIIMLAHAKDEAENEKYNGFHQWNISYEKKDLIIWKGDEKSNISDIFKDSAEIKNTVSTFVSWDGIIREYIVSEIRKIKDAPEFKSRYADNIEDMFLVLISFLISPRFRELHGSGHSSVEIISDLEKLPKQMHLPEKKAIVTMQDYHNLQNEYDSIINSRIWKFTLPLRELGKFLRKLTKFI